MARERGQFVKGTSGNPGGRPKALREVRELAQQHTTRSVARLRELIDSEDGHVALAAIKEMLDRAIGKSGPPLDDEMRDLELRLLRAKLDALESGHDVDKPGQVINVVLPNVTDRCV